MVEISPNGEAHAISMKSRPQSRGNRKHLLFHFMAGGTDQVTRCLTEAYPSASPPLNTSAGGRPALRGMPVNPHRVAVISYWVRSWWVLSAVVFYHHSPTLLITTQLGAGSEHGFGTLTPS